MRAPVLPILAIALVLGSAGCAERGASPDPSASSNAPASTLSSPAKVAPPPALDGEGVAPGSGSGSGTGVAVPPPSPEGAAPAAARGPSEEEVAECYRFARATVEHDRRIERDRGDASGFGSLGSDVGAFSDQLSRVGEASTFDRAYASCMSNKGYGRR